MIKFPLRTYRVEIDRGNCQQRERLWREVPGSHTTKAGISIEDTLPDCTLV